MSDFREMLEVEPTREVVCADCLEHMRTMPSDCVDAVITDPPYGLSFMGADWDTFGKKCGTESIEERRRKSNEYLGDNAIVPRFANGHGKAPKLDDMREFQSAMAPVFAEALRVSKPGAHLLCFGGTRTYHRMACAIEDAGWEIRDCVMWVYGSGMPHGQNVAKMAAKKYPREAESWEGWNTQLKPAWEPIIMARKPLKGTVAKNALIHGTGAINIDACRVPTEERLCTHGDEGGSRVKGNVYGTFKGMEARQSLGQELGRYPANLMHDGSQEVLELFPESKGQQGAIKGTEPSRTGEHGIYGTYEGTRTPNEPRGDSGSAARFFYCAKATRKERNIGCGGLLTWGQDQELTQLLESCFQHLKAISEFGIPNLEDGECNMTSFGNETEGLSQKECRFITSTVTNLTTELKTCNSSRPSNISEYILDAIRTSEELGINLARLAEKLNPSKQGSTNEKTDSATSAVSVLFGELSEIRKLASKGNVHPTIKPLALMEWLVKLVTRDDALVLDPFAGSGSTLIACDRLGRDFIGIERDPRYCEIALHRLEAGDSDD